MGLAASQARFLMLTARKGDLEHQGQMNNQQRTLLAHKTQELFDDLLSVPTPDPKLIDIDTDNDGTNDYEEAKIVYDARILEINNQMEALHNKDRIYEIELKNIDTQQQAVQTEIDAVQKVIDKNIDMTFKTFA